MHHQAVYPETLLLAAVQQAGRSALASAVREVEAELIESVRRVQDEAGFPGDSHMLPRAEEVDFFFHRPNRRT